MSGFAGAHRSRTVGRVLDKSVFAGVGVEFGIFPVISAFFSGFAAFRSW